MDFVVRSIVLSLAALAVTHVVVSLVVAAYWRSRRQVAGTPAQRADALLRLRLVPTIAALAVWLFAAVGLYRFESRAPGELIGLVLWAAAGLGAGLVAIAAIRLVRMQWHTRQLTRVWLRDAVALDLPLVPVPTFRIQTGFPVVAVVGILRPTLVIDAQVLAACSDEELRAILAHEGGHLRRFDNLRRLLFAAVPGPWGVGDLPTAWRTATEEAADDLAAQTEQLTRFHLAAALLRVARLAPAAGSQWPSQLPASALYRGDDIEHRVRRLVAPTDAARHPRAWWPAVVIAMTCVAALGLQRQIHDVMERVVAFLP
jgi:beta-lactamase regulating signal transducer with metallopeptidase domain